MQDGVCVFARVVGYVFAFYFEDDVVVLPVSSNR